MALPDSYTIKPGAIPAYFEAMLNAQAPERFSTRFLESLEFKSTNDRLFINVLKDLGFLDTDGVPTSRYFDFLDRSRSARVVAQGVREAFADLFAVNTSAHELSTEEVKNKLRTLYKGSKSDNVIARVASTFTALCDYADFTPAREGLPKDDGTSAEESEGGDESPTNDEAVEDTAERTGRTEPKPKARLAVDSLQYNINIVLPDSRDQAVFDAIFKSLRDHLGSQ